MIFDKGFVDISIVQNRFKETLHELSQLAPAPILDAIEVLRLKILKDGKLYDDRTRPKDEHDIQIPDEMTPARIEFERRKRRSMEKR